MKVKYFLDMLMEEDIEYFGIVFDFDWENENVLVGRDILRNSFGEHFIICFQATGDGCYLLNLK